MHKKLYLIKDIFMYLSEVSSANQHCCENKNITVSPLVIKLGINSILKSNESL